MRIALGKAEVDREAREAESINFIAQNDAAVGVWLLLRVIVKRISAVAVSYEETWLARLGQEPIAHNIQNIPCATGCAEKSIGDVVAEAVRFRTYMDGSDGLR
jgi:hypothetical protein